MKDKMLVLQNGKVYYGKGFGSDKTQIAELIYNTSMVGYQEILSDPSYRGQMVVMSYPLIGNYGLADDDYESSWFDVAALIVREYNDTPSNFRYTKTISEVMIDNNVAGISGIDTRELFRIIRSEGTMLAMVTDADRDVKECLEEIKNYKPDEKPVDVVTSKKIWYVRTKNPKYTILAVDCGIRRSTIKALQNMGANVVIVPYNTDIDTIMKYNPDGILISDGPGDPRLVPEVIETIKELKGKLPVLGECLGAELIALAYGVKMYKLKCGHRGANHPIRRLSDNKIEFHVQNHAYSADKDSINKSGLTVTQVNVLDDTAEFFEDKENGVFATMYYISDGGDVYKEFFGAVDKVVGGKGNAQENRY